MRTRINIKTWLLQRDGSAIGTIRGTETKFISTQTIEHIVGEHTEYLRIIDVNPEQLVINVK